MPSYSWIKLYHEIIDDPKMGQMPDSLWRRTIELFLLAGRNGNDGLLPALHDSAWALRSSDEQLEADLESLSKVGITHKDSAGRWHVSNFAKRQAPIDVNKRVSEYRNRAKKHEFNADETHGKHVGNESVTTSYTDTDTELDKDTETDKSKNRAPAARATPPIPIQAQIYIDSGGKFQSGTLADGTSKRDNAIRVICETVKDNEASLSLWRKVVCGYVAQWSSKSYTTMLTEYYLQGRVPGEPHRNGNGQHIESKVEAAIRMNAERRAANGNA